MHSISSSGSHFSCRMKSRNTIATQYMTSLTYNSSQFNWWIVPMRMLSFVDYCHHHHTFVRNEWVAVKTRMHKFVAVLPSTNNFCGKLRATKWEEKKPNAKPQSSSFAFFRIASHIRLHCITGIAGAEPLNQCQTYNVHNLRYVRSADSVSSTEWKSRACTSYSFYVWLFWCKLLQTLAIRQFGSPQMHTVNDMLLYSIRDGCIPIGDRICRAHTHTDTRTIDDDDDARACEQKNDCETPAALRILHFFLVFFWKKWRKKKCKNHKTRGRFICQSANAFIQSKPF